VAGNRQTRDARSAMALTTIEGAFDRLRQDESSPAWLNPLRETAFDVVRRKGFPRTRDEDWKYTNLVGFAERSADYLQNRPTGDTVDAIDSLLEDLPSIENACRIVFVNGLYRADLSSGAEPDSGIELTPFSRADSSAGEKLFQGQPVDCNTLIALNTSFLTDGLSIEVADGQKPAMPIHVVFASDGQPVATQPRLSISIGRGSEALVVQHHVSTGECLTNAVTGIDCAEQGRLFFIRLQDESAQSMHVSNQIVRIAADGRFDSVSIDFGSLLARNDLEVDMHGEQARINLHGLFMSNGNRHVDNHLRIDHRMPHTTSLENYRGILNDAARGVFNGKIIVHPGADGTDARMNNRNLLLSEQAEVDTKPELEIYTDDVKCAHGSTTGQLNPDSMFYLRARGIPETVARTMLIDAFAREIINRVRSKIPALADYLCDRVSSQLPDET